MKKSLLTIGIFALVMLFAGLGVRAHQKNAEAMVSISGKVMDQFNDPVANAEILINGERTSYSTDMNGNYSIERISTNSTLTFVCYGYETTSVIITKGGTQNDILMELSSQDS